MNKDHLQYNINTHTRYIKGLTTRGKLEFLGYVYSTTPCWFLLPFKGLDFFPLHLLLPPLWLFVTKCKFYVL